MSNDNTESISAKLRRLSAKGGDCYCEAAGEYGIECSDIQCSTCRRLLMTKIADEIDAEKQSTLRNCAYPLTQKVGKPLKGDEDFKSWLDRYYLPRPLFEDGEPVQIGDRYLMMNGTPDIASSFAYTKGDADYVRINGHRMELHERVKRPKQPVLDADGVPIEVGDAVWILKDSEHAKWTVIEPYDRYDGIQTVYVESRGIRGHACPENLTHREPDSQERIDGDALKGEYEYWGCNGVECTRCPSLVDGKKPKERYGVLWCSEAKTLDLLRRQRELDGRDA